MTDETTELVGWGPRGTAGVSFAAALHFDDVTVELGGRKVLNGFNLAMPPGEIVCLLGDSGSGKSTALRVAAGIQRIGAGRVRINDNVVSGPGVHLPPDRRGIGLMFQDFALFPHLSLLHNVTFGLNRLGRAAALAQARQALRRVGLGERENDFPHMLSGGQQQRASIARALAGNPSVILADEPTGALDSRTGREVLTFLQTLNREGNTVVLITHDNSIAIKAKRIVRLQDGKITYDGDSQDPRAVVQAEEVEGQ